MKGLLIVNNFIQSAKFGEIYSMLGQSASRFGVDLKPVKTGELPHSVKALRPLARRVDFALFWDKDIVFARQLEACGLRLFNTADAIEKCDNKGYTAAELEKAGIRTPETYVAPLTFEGVEINDFGFAEKAAEKLGFPLVVKELNGSFGQQVYLAGDLEELKSIIRGIGHKGFLMQKFCGTGTGRDVRVNVVGGKAVCAILRESINGDFRSNITLGGRASAYTLSRKQENIAVKACGALGLDFGGVDLLFGKNGEPLVCEVNSNPHFKSTLDAAGVDLGEHIIKHVIRTLG